MKNNLPTLQVKNITVVWVFFLLFSGQAVRNLIGLVGYGIISAATLALLIYLFKDSWKTKKIPVLLALFIGIATASVVWSETRGITLIAVAILLATTTAALLLAFHYKLKQLIPHITHALQISIVGSLLFELIAAFTGPIRPFFTELANISGIEGDYNWSDGLLFVGGPIQGLPGNRNLLGFLALLLVVFTIIRVLERQISKTVGVAWVLIGGSVHLLTMSASVTLAFVAVFTLLAGAYIIRRTPEKRKRTASVVFTITCVAAGVFMLRNYDLVFGWLDRGPTLSNRTSIWTAVANYALQRPEGWGWVSYWPVWKYPYSEIVHVDRLPVAHAHNAFLDVWFQLGVIGLLLLMLMFLNMLASNWRLIEHSHIGDSYMPLGVFLVSTCLFIQALSESRLLLEGNWALFILMFMYTPQLLKKRKLIEVEPIR